MLSNSCHICVLSTFTKGEQMIPVLNEVGTHCAVFGNHEFDNETGRPLGGGRITHVVEWAGRQIGLVGLVEKEWLDTLGTVNPNETTFLDFVEAGQKLAAQLKQEVRTDK
ncbi:unnamed protein product [Callosobruchus maculatus]|uniref:5'-Nucleotidase C-terminal domain-containing protein n=1 Tax=Callosobruchus maculatus TaxID=64391 RepID=A0A653DBS4_CALMS|nr:unnamed protein product [Callosobruchus maculatus]